MEEPTLKDAVAIIERLKAARPDCGDCNEFAYEALLSRVRGFVDPLPDDFHEKFGKFVGTFLSDGWEEQPHRAAYLLRCAACRQTPKYPWASRLDAERVLAHMKTKTSVWCLDELEALV
jgi:hypothetical protein